MKLFIASVGSLVGKNILDVLEYPGLSRRALVHVVGTNSLPDAANNFRCDRCYVVPETSEHGYPARLQEILLTERPDLILCARDADTLALSELKTADPALPGTLPVGSPHSALIGLDKWQTWQFSQRHGLPVAETFNPAQGAHDELEAFCARVSYPLVAKPARGYASRGVHFVRHALDARKLMERGGYIFQEYLGDPSVLESYFSTLDGPPPLHAQPPQTGHYSSQTLIAPNGDIAPPFVLDLRLEYGHAVAARYVKDTEIDALTEGVARALASEGARGPVNIAFRRDRHGSWKVQELNLRNTGSTLSRFLLGMDELHLIVSCFLPDATFPRMTPAAENLSEHVTKHMSAAAIPTLPLETLKTTGVWSRSSVS